jgi:hypothetical protein
MNDVGAAYALLVSAVMPSVLLASYLASSILVFFILFSDFLIFRTRVPKPWIWGFYVR